MVCRLSVFLREVVVVRIRLLCAVVSLQRCHIIIYKLTKRRPSFLYSAHLVSSVFSYSDYFL